MPLEFQFTCSLPNGVHARPASALEEVASCFGAEINLTNQRTGRSANAKSVLSIVGTDIRLNDSCSLRVSGADEADALAALTTFLVNEFPRCDEALPTVARNGERPLPPGLSQLGANIRRGTPVVPGIGQGRLALASGLCVPRHIPTRGATDFAAEVRKLDTALSALVASYEARLTRHASRLEGDLIKTHRSIARDPEFRARLHEALRRNTHTAAGAIADTEAHFTAMLLASESALLRERALDLQDVCQQLLGQVYGKAAAAAEPQLTEDSIVIAESLTPGQFLRLDRQRLKGLVLAHAGTTSHTVILARSFAVPTLTGVANLASAGWAGREAILDGDAGLLVTDLTAAVRRYYQTEQQRLAERRERERRFIVPAGRTADGERVEIAANLTSAEEVTVAFAAGAESIGLFRTEMIFFDRDSPPDEEEQFTEYCRVLKAAGDRPVTIRTMDFGGDKPLALLNLPAEDNPFLGYRASRLYPEFESLFRTQVRALVRASAHGRLKLLLPMLTTLEEARWAKRVIAEEQAQCRARQQPFNEQLPVGAMIEVPAAAFLLDQWCRELDFFSIGSNDLLQAFAAADRTDPRLARFYDPLQPAFLRLLQKIVTDAHAGGKRVGLCGEIGGQPQWLPLLVGLGLDEISAAPSALPALKAELAAWSATACRELVRQAVACASADAVRELISSQAARPTAPLIEPELILMESDSATKAEAIKEAVDRLYVLGRTEEPREVEQAVWQREAVYSTGFGHGFAIPHCKTPAVNTNSIAVLKLRNPVAWGSLDHQPVRVMILLAIRESEQAGLHMQILSRLARKVMHDDFRDRLSHEQNPAALCAFLAESLSA